MKKLLDQLLRKDLLAINAMQTELGYKTKRGKLSTLSQCEDWLRNRKDRSIMLVFDNDKQETLEFRS